MKSVFLGLLGLRKDKRAGPISREVIVRNLLDARSILNSLEIIFWLTDGTLLGYFREKDVIGHDIDVDLGLMIDAYSDTIIPAFLQQGFEVKYLLG